MGQLISVSVRELVEFIMRGGSIDNRGGFASLNAYELMREGVRLHNKLQKLRKKEASKSNSNYESEARLFATISTDKFDLTVEGRADGIWRSENNEAIVEEIKSTTFLPVYVDKNHWHFGQVKCYAHMLCRNNPAFDGVTVRLTYIHSETEEIVEFPQYYTASELEDFFFGLTNKYLVWQNMDYDRKKARDSSIKSGKFPYPSFRKGQREFSVTAYRAIERNKKLYIEAPTGTGKTISAIFPTVKSISEGFCDKFFYLTAKTITRTAAEQALFLMNQQDYKLLSVTLTAKEKICLCENPLNCNPLECSFADGHFDRVNDAVMDIIKSGLLVIKRDDILDCAQKHNVCPHELQLDVSTWTDAVICDYNYAFDPKVQLQRFFGQNSKNGKYAFLVDEAHNLVERAREMFSAELRKSSFREARKFVRGKDKPLYKIFSEIIEYFSEIGDNISPDKFKVLTTDKQPSELYVLLKFMVERMNIWLAQLHETPDDSVIEVYFSAVDFLNTSETFDEHFTVFMESGRDVSIKLMCLNPSSLLATALSKSCGSIFFSATLTPCHYFKNVLGGNKDDYMARLPSPFDREKLCVLIENRVSTRYKDRAGSYESIAELLHDMIIAKRGNYFAFFSSYIYLEKVLEVFLKKFPEENTLVQSRNFGEKEREEFLSRFNDCDNLLAFAVMGGVFSEGIDLVGEKLIGAAIVGVGLPLVSEERDVISRYYDKTLGSGFEYAYMFPGMNKVLQAAGRVIRSEEDKGVVLLIDDRFTTNRYLSLFPHEWKNFVTLSTNDIQEVLNKFWGKE